MRFKRNIVLNNMVLIWYISVQKDTFSIFFIEFLTLAQSCATIVGKISIMKALKEYKLKGVFPNFERWL